NLTHALGLTEEVEPSIYHLLKQEMVGQQGDIRQIITTTQSGLELVPASLELAGAELELVSVYGREQLIKRLLVPVEADYDYILLDCPPAIGMLTVNALIASDWVLMPMQSEFLPLRGLKSFIRHFEVIQRTMNPRLNLLGIMLSRFDSRKNMHKAIRTELQELYPKLLLNTTIRSTIKLSEATAASTHIFAHAPTSNGAEDYLFLAHEVHQRILNWSAS
ncbi:MAG: ParA family protein, partial [Bacteroidota bacterium]